MIKYLLFLFFYRLVLVFWNRENLIYFFSFCSIEYRKLNLEVLIRGSTSKETERNKKKLDWLGPFDYRPSTWDLHHFFPIKKREKK